MIHHVRRVNATRVLRTILLNPGISRTEISRLLDLNKSTISKIVNRLEEIEIIEEAEVGEPGPSGGRRPIHLRIRPDWGCIMGVEIQTEGFTVVGIDLDGELYFSHTEPLDLRTTNLVDAFVWLVRRFRASLEATGMPLVGIGVGLPGFVDPVRGVLRSSIPFELFGEVAFVAEARAALGLEIPILVDNDANCGCWGELAVRNSTRPRNFLFVLGELRKHTIALDDYRIMALGLGLVINGEVYHGDQFSAGEFRSILFNPAQVNQFSITDDQARRFLRDREVNALVIDELARHIAFLVNILNLRRVVIGGEIEALAEEIIQAVRHHLGINWAYPEPVDCKIAVSRLGEQAVAFGAAAMYLEHLIRVPTVAEADTANPTVGIDLLPSLAVRIDD